MPSEMSRRVSVQSTRSPSRRVVPRDRQPEDDDADTRNVSPSTQSASNSRSTSSAANALEAARATRRAYDEQREGEGRRAGTSRRRGEETERVRRRELLVSTRLGIDASFAGPHSSVRISSKNDTRTSPTRLSTNGSSDEEPGPSEVAHDHRRWRRSKRSTMTPPTVARKNPGTTRATITRLTAAPDPPDTRAAIARIAMMPIQSPRLETHLGHPQLEERAGAEDAPEGRRQAGLLG